MPLETRDLHGKKRQSDNLPLGDDLGSYLAESPVLPLLGERLIQFKPHVSATQAVLYCPDNVVPVFVNSLNRFKYITLKILFITCGKKAVS